MSMTTAMDGIGDVNHIDTVHDDISKEYKEAMEKTMASEEKVVETVAEAPAQESTAEVRPLTEEERAAMGEQSIKLDQQRPTNIWLQFNTVSVGWTEDGQPRATYDIMELFNGLVALGHAVSVQFAAPQPEQPVEENATDDIEEVKQEAKWQHNGQPDNPTTNE